MFKQICFFRKRPDMTMQQFMDYYEHQHSTIWSVPWWNMIPPMGPLGEATRVALRYGD